MFKVSFVYVVFAVGAILSLSACKPGRSLTARADEVDTLSIQYQDGTPYLDIELKHGPQHNHPSFAIWMEQLNGTYIQTLFATRSIATGIFNYGPKQKEVWDNKPGWQKRPASLPYWLHKRSAALGAPLLPDPDHPAIDVNSGATPKGDFKMMVGNENLPSEKFNILLEINQPWDWNQFWTNDLYDDPDYRSSCQPSLIYSVTIDPKEAGKKLFLNPIGHGHYSGATGELYTDLRTLTTAKEIVELITVQLKK